MLLQSTAEVQVHSTNYTDSSKTNTNQTTNPPPIFERRIAKPQEQHQTKVQNHAELRNFNDALLHELGTRRKSAY